MQNDPSYAATDAVDWSSERDRQQQAYQHSTDTSEIKQDGQSLEGYRKAWENLSAKLEAGKDDYLFQPNNKYLSDTGKSDTPDLFSEGMRLFKEGKIREAVVAFEAEAQRDSSNSEAWRMLGTSVKASLSNFYLLSIHFLPYFLSVLHTCLTSSFPSALKDMSALS